MKQYKSLKNLLLFLLVFVLSECKQEENELSASYVRFQDLEVTIPYYNAEVPVFVEWSETKWIIEAEVGDVVSEILPAEGGNETELEQISQVLIKCNQNTSGGVREQKIVIRNLTTSEKSEMILVQKKPEEAIALEKTESLVPYLGGSIKINVMSSETEWIIEKGNGNLITGVKNIDDTEIEEGGSLTETDYVTSVVIEYSENTTSEERSQTITLVNKNNDENRVSFTLKQDAKYNVEKTANLNINQFYQDVVGFGGMYNPKIWGSAHVPTDIEIEKLFSDNGLGYNILRLMIYDNRANWTDDIRGAKMAQDLGAYIFGSPWYCPLELGEEKSNNGEKYRVLYKENWEKYANHLSDYVTFMKDNNVNLHAISVQNEPDMHFTYWNENGSGPADVADFVAQYGNIIRNKGVKLMSPEACGYQLSYNNAVINSENAWNNTDILAGHLYQGFIPDDPYVNSWTNSNGKSLRDFFSKWDTEGKQWWMTEHLFNDGISNSDQSQWYFQTWDYNLSHLAKEIHYCMYNNCSAYVYWYLKRSYGMIGDNEKYSPVAEGEITKNGYIMSHYAKYAKESKRVSLELENDDQFLGTAYKQGDDITLVLLNLKEEGVSFRIPLMQIGGNVTCSSVVTNEMFDMETLTVKQTNDNLEVPIPAKSIVSIRVSVENN